MPIKVRKSISNLQTYNVGGRSDLSSDWECFDWNESEFPPTNKVFEVMKSFYRYERYPDITAKQLKNKLSEYVSLPVDFIEVYNGSDDALKDIILCLLIGIQKYYHINHLIHKLILSLLQIQRTT